MVLFGAVGFGSGLMTSDFLGLQWCGVLEFRFSLFRTRGLEPLCIGLASRPEPRKTKFLSLAPAKPQWPFALSSAKAVELLGAASCQATWTCMGSVLKGLVLGL